MEDTKVYALYLPQYYETNYNSDWWGKGYTEWFACKQAKPLNKNHYQPRVPLNNHYYDLSVKDEIANQAKIAKEYGVDGFIIYQYYSCNDSEYGDKNGKHGRMLLNKPTEIIRDNKDIDIPFCLYWANHDWRKLWFGKDPTLLWPLEYGKEEDWKEFFEYNLKYFKDERYIKVDNKPMYFIFRTDNFKQVDSFMKYWNELAKENGFDGIYFVKTLDARTNKSKGNFDAVHFREPLYTFSKGFSKSAFFCRAVKVRIRKFINKRVEKFDKGIIADTCDYDKAWNSILNRDEYGEDVIPGAFADWDNYPRKGYDAMMLKNATPEKFKIHFKKLLDLCRKKKVPFMIINAWNEWAEGAYLEPDEKYKFAYLEAIKACKEERK